MTANRPLSNLFGDKAPCGRGQIKISTLSTINHRDLSLRPIIPGALPGCFPLGFQLLDPGLFLIVLILHPLLSAP